MDPSAILIITPAVIIFMTLIGISYKTGFVSYSIWSLTRKDQPRFKIDKTKISRFIGVNAVVFLVSIAYGLLILRDMHEIVGVLILSLFNTIVIAYGLSFWILLKEKSGSKKSSGSR